MRSIIPVACAITLAAAIAACSGGTKPTQCSYSVSPAQVTIAASGGTSSIGVAAPSGCQWTADLSPASSWITPSGMTGTGAGTVTLTATANNSTDARSVQITAHGATGGTASASVRQDGLVPNNCGADSYQVSPTAHSLPASGGSFSVTLSAGAGCAWTTSADSWLTVTNRGPGFGAAGLTGTGTITLDISATTNADAGARTGTATIAGHVVTVVQDGTASSACSYTLNTSVLNFNAAGGTGAVSVTTSTNCSWYVDVTNATEDFVRVSSADVTGSGTRSFTVLPNRTMTPLSGRLNVFGRSGTSAAPFGQVTVNQAGAGCLYTVTPDSASYAATGGLGSFRVTTTPSDCSWTASIAGPLFVTITGGGSGTGAATVTYQVNANTGASRSGGITIAGLSGVNPPATHTINQAGTAFGGPE